MIAFKEHIAQQMIGKRLRFKCDCLFPMDIIGTIKSYKVSNNEIIFNVEHSGKMIEIGENHPKLTVEEV